MKYYVFVISLAFSFSCFGQWTSLNSGSSEWLRGVDFPTSDTGFVVGYNGTILRTLDEGLNWSNMPSGTTNHLNSVYFINSSTGWACGDSGTILNTIDAGASWAIQSNSGSNLAEIYFLNSTTGYVAGSMGTCWKTTDGGVNWNPLVLSGGTSRPVSLFFNNTNIGYVVGLGQADAIMKTTNAGSNWNNIHPNTFAEFGSVYFTHLDTGYVCSTGAINKNILKTVDGGITWNIVHSLTFDGLYSLKFPTSQKGYAAGGYPSSSIMLYTADAGANWVSQNTSISQPLFDCFFVNENLGYAVGMNGSIIKTTNGGGVGMDELASSLITVYPNPFKHAISISLEESSEAIVTVRNSIGQLVLTEKFDNTKKLDISLVVPAGIYFLQLKVDGQVITKKDSEKLNILLLPLIINNDFQVLKYFYL